MAAVAAVWFGFAVCAARIGVAGTLLARYADINSDKTGLSHTWVGLVLLATVTSLPELAVTLGALDMPISSLLGSNLFNFAMLALDDLLDLKGPLLAQVSPVHAVSALSAIMMTGVAIVGLFYRARTRLFGSVGWTSIVLLALYLLSTYILFLYGK